MLSTVDAVQQRRSVRAFQPQPVDDALMQRVFALAQQAPSNCNTQPWVVHVASGEAASTLRQRLTEAGRDPAQHRPDFPFDGRYPGVYRDRQFDAAQQLYGAMGIARDDKSGRAAAALRNYDFFGAPHAAFVFLPEPFGLREAADCGIYAQTLMLLLTAHGVASCPQAALSFHPHIVREVLAVPTEHRLLLGIAIGYEDARQPANRCRIGRAALGEAVTFHR